MKNPKSRAEGTTPSGLLIASAANAGSLGNVLWALREHLDGYLRIDKVLLLDAGEECPDLGNLRTLTHAILGEHTELRERPCRGKFQEVIPAAVADGAREVGRENVVLDLTTGTKTISAILYACGSFSQLGHLYYVAVERINGEFPILWKDGASKCGHEVIEFPPLRDVRSLASHSFFDLILYLEEIDSLASSAPGELSTDICDACNHLRDALPHFFGNGQHYLSAMRSVGAAREHIQSLVFQAACAIHPSAKVETMKQLTQWCDDYRDALRNGTCTYTRAVTAIPGLVALDALMKVLQTWRNAAAHRAPPDFGPNEIRVALLAMIDLIQTVIAVHAAVKGAS